ncbi:MAG: hypothetical protein R3A45_05530 [Bdellovibrionota bacterium]
MAGFLQVLTQVQGFDAYGTYFTQAVGEDDYTVIFHLVQIKIITGGSFVFVKSTSEIVEKNRSWPRSNVIGNSSYPNFLVRSLKTSKPAFAGALIEEVGLKVPFGRCANF